MMMASTIKFLGPTISQNLNTMHRNCQPSLLFQLGEKDPIKMNCGYITRKREKLNQLKRNRPKNIFAVSASSNNDNSTGSLFSGYDVIMQFYSSINQKNMNTLSSCLSGDCYIDDYSFPKAFRGKKEVMKFSEQLVKSMGQNVKFCVENVCDKDKTAAVNWHLEWKGRKIPLTRGCSFYEFAEEGGKLVIRNGRVLIESPIKPGGVVLALLKNITFLFDEYPNAADWFLAKPQTIIKIIIRIYGLTLAPFVNHMMAAYLKLIHFVARFLLLLLTVFIKIRSCFPK